MLILQMKKPKLREDNYGILDNYHVLDYPGHETDETIQAVVCLTQ